ncbi:MAG: hypothetical protein HKN01_01370 [Acidimicrobiia bacterium]|nr:hypothetical protein [Acidimicrobiia bacterium]
MSNETERPYTERHWLSPKLFATAYISADLQVVRDEIEGDVGAVTITLHNGEDTTAIHQLVRSDSVKDLCGSLEDMSDIIDGVAASLRAAELAPPLPDEQRELRRQEAFAEMLGTRLTGPSDYDGVDIDLTTDES